MQAIAERLKNFPGTAGIVIHNLATGERFAHNPHQSFNAASLIKLPVLWTLFAQAAQGAIDVDEQTVVEPPDVVPGFGVLRHLAPGQRVTWRDLALLMIIVSDNTATNMLVDRLSKAEINRNIAALAMADTALKFKMFEERPEHLFNVTSPADVAAILAHFAQAADGPRPLPPLAAKLGPFAAEPLRMLEAQLCKNKLAAGLPKEVRFAHKTGEVKNVEHDAGVLFVNNQPIVIVVMTRDLHDSRDGIALCRDVARLVYDDALAKA